MSINRVQNLIYKSPLLNHIQSPKLIPIIDSDINTITELNEFNLQQNENLLLNVDWISFGKYIFLRDNNDNKIEMFIPDVNN